MKQNNMFKRGLLKATSWTLVHTSWITMTLSPVAMGKQAENNQTQNLKQYVQMLGLNKKTTIKEFFEKVKTDLPGYSYFELEQLAKENPNALMPQFDVKSSKASDGTMVPVLSFTENGKTHTMQVYGDKEKFLKFDNTLLTESEVLQPDMMLQKVIESDPKLSERYEKAFKQQRKVSSVSKKNTGLKGFTLMTKDLWKQMTPEDRVSYIIQMRRLYINSQEVLEQKSKPSKKTSSVDLFELLFKSMVNDAQAAPPEVDMPCIVAGYVGKYNSKKKCSVEEALKGPRYNQGSLALPPIVAETNKKCTPGTVACNPYVYSYNDQGLPYCISTTDADFQQATHWESKKGGKSCDQMSRLSNYELKAAKPLTDDEAKKKYNEQGVEDANGLSNLDLSKKFIANYLKSNANQEFSKCVISGIMTPACEGLIGEINAIGKEFKNDIESAVAICEKNKANHIVGYDSQQGGACNQIGKRWLAFETLIKGLKCPEGQVFDNPDAPTKCIPVNKPPEPVADKKCEDLGAKTSKNEGNCLCMNGDGEVSEFPISLGKLPDACNKKCTPDKPCPPEEPKEASCEDDYKPLKIGSDLNDDCTCKNAKSAKYPKEDQPGFFKKLFNSKKNKEFNAAAGDDKPHTCKLGLSAGTLIGIGAGVIGVGVLAYFAFKKKTKTVTQTVTKTDTVTNTVDHTVTCAPPKYAVLVASNAVPGKDRFDANGASASLKTRMDTTDNKKTRMGASSRYECVCPPCKEYMLTSGQSYQSAPNPVTCECSQPPSEGNGVTPVDANSGGIPTQN